MEDKGGEFYYEGRCIITGEDCKRYVKGACCTCLIVPDYEKFIEKLVSQEGGLSELCGETLKT